MFSFDQFIQNNRSEGGVHVINGQDLAGMNWDPGLLRPYRDDHGRVWVDVTVGTKQRTDNNGNPVFNSVGAPVYDRVFEPQLISERIRRDLPVINVNNATVLRKDQWIQLDMVVQQSVRARLRAWADLRAANTYGGFDGMATPILEHELISDPGEAIADMDGLSEGRNLQPSFGLQGLPLPITHSDFFLSSRFLAASRTKGQPQDTQRAEIAGRRVGELIERTAIGTVDGVTFGSDTSYLQISKVYGYRNHPARITKTDLTASSSFDGETFVDEVIQMRELAYTKNFFGPFILYVSTAYDAKLDGDYLVNSGAESTSPTRTIRERVRQIDGITDVRRLDYLTGDELLLVQMTGDVAQAVNGLEVTTVQWETKGGMQLNFKVLGIQVPRIRSSFLSQTMTEVTGIVHGTTA